MKKYCAFDWVTLNLIIIFSKISIFMIWVFSYKSYVSPLCLGIYGSDLLGAVYNFIHIVLYDSCSVYAQGIYDFVKSLA